MVSAFVSASRSWAGMSPAFLSWKKSWSFFGWRPVGHSSSEDPRFFAQGGLQPRVSILSLQRHQLGASACGVRSQCGRLGGALAGTQVRKTRAEKCTRDRHRSVRAERPIPGTSSFDHFSPRSVRSSTRKSRHQNI